MTRSVLVFLVVSLACAPQHAEEAPAPQAGATRADPVLAELGKPVYESKCASCHGLDARGGGPAAAALDTPPADLRRIAARRGGVFPDAEIARRIDGRFDVPAHGTREMPVWGEVFTRAIPDGEVAESVSRGNVAVLVEYLKSLQDPSDGGSAEATRREMAEIFDAMQYLLPLSLDARRFEDPANDAEILHALDLLDASATTLERHGATGDVGFAHLAHSLAIDARDARRRYEMGHKNEVRYLVQTLTETCVACHSRLPAGSAPRSDAFVQKIEQQGLPLEQRAKLAYATRQFDVAGDLYEQLLASPEVSANDIDLGGHIDDYLELSIRVQRDLGGPAAQLRRFEQRKDLSRALRSGVRAWIASLDQLAGRERTGTALEQARRLVDDPAQPLSASERGDLVPLLEASGLLNRALASGALSRQERAEAYYLLGVIETRIGRSYWLSQAEAYLETAIRLAPGEPTAVRAYELLDEFLTAGFSGSAGTNLPPDIDAKLDQLRRIALGA